MKGQALTTRQSLALFAAVLLVPTAMFALSSQGATFFSISGSTACVEGADQLYIDSNAQNYEDNKAWKIMFSSGCNEKIAGGGGEISKEDLEDTSDGNVVTAEKGFTLGLTDFEAWFEKGVYRSNSQEVWSHEIRVWDCNLLGDCSDKNAEAQDWQDETSGEIGEIIEVKNGHVVASKAVKKYGEIYSYSSNTNSDFQGQVTLCADGQFSCPTATFDKDNPLAVLNSAGHRAEVRWAGSRIGDIRSVDYSGTIPVYNSRKNELVVTGQGFEDDYTNSIQTMQDCIETSTDLSNIENKCDVTDDDAQNVVSDQSQLITNKLTFEGDLEIVDGMVRVTAEDDNAIERPVFEATIDTGWIGIIEQVPKPSIQGLQDFSIKEQNSVTVEVPVKNAGKSDGQIQTTVNCESPLTGGSQRLDIASGETRRFSIQVTGGSGTTGLKTCDVEARATGSNTKDTGQFSVTLKEKTEDCPECFGNNNDDSTGGGKGSVVHPPTNDGINPGKIAIVLLVLATLGGGIYWLRQRGTI